MKKLFLAIGIFILIPFQFLFAGKEDLQKGWDSFIINKREEAKKYFLAATQSDDSKAEGFLGLAFLAKEQDNAPEAFDRFVSFFNSSDNPLPYTYALWNTACLNPDYGKKSPEQLKFLEKLLTNPKTTLTLKAMTLSMLGKHYEVLGNFSKASSYYNQIQAINNWKIVGTFENISSSGFDKNYPPVYAKSANESYPNKVGVPVQWIDIPGARKDQWVDFSYFFYYNQSIMFGQTFINSPDSRDALLRIGTSGSLKVWLNDKLVSSFSEETNNDLDTYLIKVKLAKGNNRLLLQIGESEDIGACNFMVRLSDMNEKNFSDITYNKEFVPYNTGDTTYTAELQSNPYEVFFQNKIKEQPNNILNYLLLTEAYSRNEKKHEMRKVLKTAREIAPNSSTVSYLMLTLYLKTKNRTFLSKEIEWLKAHDPDNYFALTYRVEEEFDKEDYDDAALVLNKLESIYGTQNKANLQYLLQNRIKIAAQKDQVEQMTKLVNEAYEKFPDVYAIVNMKTLLEKAITKDTKKVITIWEKYVRDNYSESAYLNLAQCYFDIARVDKALKVYEMLIKDEPLSIGYVSTLGDKYYDLQRYNDAAGCYLKCIKQSPYISTYWSALGQTYEQLGKKDQAIDAYRKSLLYRPTAYKEREKLRNLENKKDIFTNFDSVDIYQLAKNASSSQQFPDDNSLVLLHDVQKVVYKEGASEAKENILIKVLNKEGVDEWKEYGIGYNYYTQKLIIEKAEIIKSNGSKVSAERKDNNIVFTALEPGDAIHVLYRVQDFYSGILATQFWDKQYMSGFYPCQKVKYSLLVDKSIKFQYKTLNTDITPAKKDIENFTLYSWETNNEPALKQERYMPPLTDVAKVLYISSIPDWKFVSSWYTDLAKTKAKAEYEVKEALDEMFAGKTNLTQLQKAKMIYEFIVDNIRYSSVSFRQSGHIPQKAITTLNTRLGDCKDVSTLFAAMCHAEGIPVSLMLVDTRDNGAHDMLLPSIDFNHCIAKANADGKDYIIEMTSDKIPFGAMPEELKKAFALEINIFGNTPADAPVYLNPPTRLPNILERSADVSFDGTTMNVKKENMRTGNFIPGLKATFLDKSKEDREKRMLETIATDYPAKVKLTSLDFVNLDSFSDSIQYRYSFSVNDAFTKIGGILICKLPWSDRIESIDFLSSDTRKLPIEFWNYVSADKQKEMLNIIIPQGKTVVEMPKSQKFSCFLADYSIRYEKQGNKIVAIREITYKDDYVPVNKYSELKSFYANIVAADAEQIAFK